MKRKSFNAFMIGLIMCMVLAGCGGSADNSISDKLQSAGEKAASEADGEDDEKADDKDDAGDKEKPERRKKKKKDEPGKDIEITDISWNHSDEAGYYPDNTEVYFKLSNGDTVTKEIPFPTFVEGMDKLDMDDDGKDEILINQYFANTAGEYSIVYIYKLLDGEVEEIFPGNDIPELKDEFVNTEVVYTETRYLLDVTTYEKDGADVSEKYHAMLMWNDGSWVANDKAYKEEDEEGTIPEYFEYVKAPDGYANLRTGPGTEYDVICQIPNGGELEVYREDATSKSGKKWLKVAYYREADNEDGYEWLTGWIAESQLQE